MRFAIFLALVVWGSSCLAQTATNGTYVVVRGAVKGCEDWTERILDIEEVKDDKPINLLDISNINVVGLEGKGIQLLLESEIKIRTGNEPKSIKVQVLDLIRLPRGIWDQYRFSLFALLDGECPVDPQRIPVSREPPTYPERLEKEIEKLRRLELSRALVWGVLYNKSFNPVAGDAGAA